DRKDGGVNRRTPRWRPLRAPVAGGGGRGGRSGPAGGDGGGAPAAARPGPGAARGAASAGGEAMSERPGDTVRSLVPTGERALAPTAGGLAARGLALAADLA